MWVHLIKLGGWGILLAYLANEPVVFEPQWVGLYLAINVVVQIVCVPVIMQIVIFLWKQTSRLGVTTDENKRTSTFLNEKYRVAYSLLRRPVLNLMLVPGEDGLVVPLLLVGVTWLSALPFAVLFGFAHYGNSSPANCVGKAASAYLFCLFVLPHGILHVAVGHLLLNAVIIVLAMIVLRAENYAARGEERYQQGAYEKAIADLSEAIRLNPKLEYCLHTRGHAWVALGEFDRAQEDYDAALALNPRSAEAYAARGIAWSRKGRDNEALADFEQALKLNPLLDWAFNGRAAVRLDGGEYDLAIADYTEALRLQPEKVDYLVGRSTAFYERGDIDKALADCERAIVMAPDHVVAHSNLGWTLFEMGRYKEAIRSFEKGLALDGNCSFLLNGLAWILATCPDHDVRDGKRALDFAYRLSDGPYMPQWRRLSNLAAACAECGRYGEAVSHLTAALESMPEHKNAEVQAMLAAFQAGNAYYFKPRGTSNSN